MLLQPAARPRRRQQRLNQRPLLVGQVRGVPPLSRHPATLMASTFMVTQTRHPKIQKLLKHAPGSMPLRYGSGGGRAPRMATASAGGLVGWGQWRSAAFLTPQVGIFGFAAGGGV